MEDLPAKTGDVIESVTLAIREHRTYALKDTLPTLTPKQGDDKTSPPPARLLKNGFVQKADVAPLSVATSLTQPAEREAYGWDLDASAHGELGLWRVERPPSDKPYHQDSSGGDEGWLGTDWDNFGKNNIYDLNDADANPHASVAKWQKHVEQTEATSSLDISLLTAAWNCDNQDAADVILDHLAALDDEKDEKTAKNVAQDILCDVIDTGKFDQYEAIATKLKCLPPQPATATTPVVVDTPHFLPAHPRTKKTILSSLYQQLSCLCPVVEGGADSGEGGAPHDMFQKNNVFVISQEAAQSINLLKPILNNAIQSCLHHAQCQAPGPVHNAYNDESGEHELQGVPCRFLQLGVEVEAKEMANKPRYDWTSKVRNEQYSTLCTHRGCILAHVEEHFPYVVPFENFYNPNSIAYMLERNVVSIRPYEGLAWGSGDHVDLSEGFSGASSTIETVFQIAHVAPTLTKFLWFTELLKLPYQQLLFLTEHVITGFKDILNNLPFDELYKVLLHQGAACIGKWLYLISFYNPELLQTIYERDLKSKKEKSHWEGVYQYASCDSDYRGTTDKVCWLVDLVYNFKCYALLFVNRCFNYNNYGVHMDEHLPLHNSNEYEKYRWQELNQKHWVLSAEFLQENFDKMLEHLKKKARQADRHDYHYGTLHNADGDVVDTEEKEEDDDEDYPDREGYGGPERDEWGLAWNGMDDHMISFCPPPPGAPHYADYKYLKFVVSALFLPFYNTPGTACYPQCVSEQKEQQEDDAAQPTAPPQLHKGLIPAEIVNKVLTENTAGSDWLANMTTALPNYLEDDGEMVVTDIRKGLRFIRTAAYNTFDLENRWLNHNSQVHTHQFNLILLDHALQLKLKDVLSSSSTDMTADDAGIAFDKKMLAELVKKYKSDSSCYRWETPKLCPIQSALCALELDVVGDEDADLALFNNAEYDAHLMTALGKLVADVPTPPPSNEDEEQQ